MNLAFGGRKAQAVLVAVTLLLYAPTVHYDFLDYDDGLNVTDNPYLKDISPGGVLQFWLRPYASLYIPVTYSFFSAEAVLARWIGGGSLDPRVFHAGNILLHVGTTLLVYRLLERYFSGPGPALAGTLLFAVHPLHVESVAWITEAKGLLSGLFTIAALILFDRFLTERKWTAYFFSTILFLLAVLSKPNAVAVPLIAGILAWGFRRASWKPMVGGLVPWFALALAVYLWTKPLQEDAVVWHVPTIAERAWVALDAAAFYLRSFFWPKNLGPDYGRSPTVVLSEAKSMTSVTLTVAPLLLVAAAASLSRWRRYWWTCIGVFVAGLAPVLGIIPFEFQNISTVADRYAYVPLLGPAFALAVAVNSLQGRSRAALVVLFAPIFAWSIVSNAQKKHWANDEALFSRALVVRPTSSMAHLGIGNVFLRKKDFQRALVHYQSAAELQPASAGAHYNLGGVYFQLGQFDVAERELREALRLRPNHEKSRGKLVRLLSVQSNRAIQERRPADALNRLRSALELDPNNAAVANRLAWLLVTRPENDLRNLKEASSWVKTALLRAPQSAGAWETLSAVHAEAGRFEEARATIGRAIELAEKNEPASLQRLRSREKSYEQKRPIREGSP